MLSLSPLLCALLLAAAARAGSPWPPEAAAWARAQVAKMSLHDLVQYTYGHETPPHEPSIIPAYPQFGTPRMQHLDGPQGVCCTDKVTAFPSALSVSMSWDLALAYRFAAAVGREQFLKGTTIVLGPAVNIARVPWGGRLFEYVGEDPFLASRLAVPLVLGLQSNNISGCIKHYVANNQEYERFTVSANVNNRVLHELYLPAFRAAVDAGVGSVMCSYNRINRTYSCENNSTLVRTLKGRFGFQGWVRSDGGATLSTLYANGGLDQEMPAVEFFGPALEAAVNAGHVPLARVQDMVTRILTSLYALHMLEHPSPYNISNNARSREHDELARVVAEQGTVLLKNERALLPLEPAAARTIAVFGDNKTITGDGSGYVNAPYVITPVEGIRTWVAQHAAGQIEVVYGGRNASTAAEVAAKVDVCVVVVATDSSEGSDRKNLSLDTGYDELVAAVAAANAKTVVVVRAPGPVVMPWVGAVPAILFAGLQGQEAGNALANVLFGDVNPGGKLTLSFPTSMNDTWLSLQPGGPVNPEQYPGTDRGLGFLEADYLEQLLVGYRYYDQMKIEPLFPFGHGLSYTTFEYSDLAIAGIVSAQTNATVSLTVANVGSVVGAEIVQLYVAFPSAAGEPPQQLKGFDKQVLAPAARHTVVFKLTAQDLSIFDEAGDDWRLLPGTYGIAVGASSRDIRLRGTVQAQ